LVSKSEEGHKASKSINGFFIQVRLRKHIRNWRVPLTPPLSRRCISITRVCGMYWQCFCCSALCDDW